VGDNYNKNITAMGGHGPYTFAVTVGSLPNGLTLTPDGHLSGVPTTEGDFTFTITATDSRGCTGKRQYTISIKCETITVKPFTLGDGTVGRNYNKNIHTSGGHMPFIFTVENGNLPPGLTLSPDGNLSGVPTAEGSFTFTILATDQFGCTGKRLYTIDVKCPNINVTPGSLPDGRVNHPYSRLIRASGPNTPYTFAVTNGNLPNGLTLAPGGLLSGTPTAGGNFTFTITAKDSFGCDGKRQYEIEVDNDAN
jgi:large repetitive protein